MRYQHEKVFLLGMLMFLVLTGCQEKKIVRIGPPPPFIRGDVNGDMVVQEDDAIFTLRYLYIPGSETPPCMDAADANDNGEVLMGDAMYIFKYLYAGGAQPPEPFPNCGTDPTTDELGCESHPCMEAGT